jgi:subtilase family protein
MLRSEAASSIRACVLVLLAIMLGLGCGVAGSAAPSAPPQWVKPPERPVQHDPLLRPQLVQANALIRAGEARSTYAVNGNGMSVAVLDTGLRTTHVDFSGRVPAARNFTSDNGGDPFNAADGNGHGTNVGGIIAANSIHVGIAPGASILPLKVLPNQGAGSFFAIDQALQWVIDNRAAYNIGAVNLSLSDGGNYTSQPSDAIRTKFQTLRAARVAVVCAAGNEFYPLSQQGMGYPAIFPESVSVGAVFDADVGAIGYTDGAQAATTGPDRVTPFSQRLHPNVQATNRTDIFAPGAPITSSGNLSDTGASTQHGTSQAAPVMAGVILLLQEYHLRVTGTLPTVDKLEAWLRAGAVTMVDGDDENDNVTNTGLAFPRVDVMGAMQAMVAEIGGVGGGSVTITSPNGGEVQTIGTNQGITWTSSSITGNVKIEYSNTGGASWLPIYTSTENDGFALWTVQGPPTTQARIRVSSVSNPAVTDISNANFTLSGSTGITLTYPNGGDVQVIGTDFPIRWTAVNGSGNVRIEWSPNAGGTWFPIYTNTPNDGFAWWTVQHPVTAQARIRVTWLLDTGVFDVSDANFTIRGNSITVLSPNGGEVQVFNTNQSITWSSVNAPGNVKIEYSNNGGASWFPIYTSTENDGFALWTVQGPATSQARIRISSLADPACSDISDANFTINSGFGF